jgi:hypothetical protein
MKTDTPETPAEQEHQLGGTSPGEEEEEEDDINSIEDYPFFLYREIKTFENIPPITLDDGICETFGRELESMAHRFSVVLCPVERKIRSMKTWDLWGPFFMVLIFGVFINSNPAPT